MRAAQPLSRRHAPPASLPQLPRPKGVVYVGDVPRGYGLLDSGRGGGVTDVLLGPALPAVCAVGALIAAADAAVASGLRARGSVAVS